MKVLVATGLYPPEIGGPATYSKTLNEKLPGHGFSVVVLPFSSVRKFPKLIRHAVYFIGVLSKGRHADLIYAQDPVSVGFPSALVAFILRKRFIVKIVGDYAWEQGVQRFGVSDSLDEFSLNKSKSHRMVGLLKKIEFFVARRAEKIIVPSEYLKKIVSRWGIPKEKVEVIYNSFNGLEDPGNRDTVRGLLHFKGTLITSVGRIVPWKGFMTLIELMPKIIKEIPDAKLLIIGAGPDEEKLQKRVEELDLGERVSLTGALPHDVLLRYLIASDMFVLNTSYEGFSHLLLEVMALGLPIVTTNVGGNPELIENGKNGMLVPFDDKQALRENIVKVVKTQSLKDKLIREGLKRVEDFNEDRMIKETIKALSK
ncbi:MAG: glycosyltransferase family 4 protein [Parcubacteria group bacterium]|nr:glycosyltransferase family 4 protein [Parcubacteria group bacterium]